jgi:hypothetical protein
VTRQVAPSGFEHGVDVVPSFDHRDDPTRAREGQHVAEIRLAVIGSQGAVILRIFTGWTWGAASREGASGTDRVRPMDAGVFWHARPVGTDRGDACEWLGTCVDAGWSALAGEAPWRALVREGEDACWKQLEALYQERWGGTSV